MTDQDVPFTDDNPQAKPLHIVRPDALDAWLATRPPAQAAFLRDSAFTGQANELRLLPGPAGVEAAVLGIGRDRSAFAFGGLAFALPEGVWKLTQGDYDHADATLGFGLGAFRYTEFRAPKRPPPAW